MNLDTLKDIKPYEPLVINWSIYIVAVSLLITCVVLIVAYMIHKRRSQKTEDIQQKATTKLKQLNFDTDDKTLIYYFTIYSKVASTKQNETLDDIYKRLEPYKYRKNIEKLDNNIKDSMKVYIESLR